MIVEFFLGFGLGFGFVQAVAMEFHFEFVSVVASTILRFILLIVASLLLQPTIRIIESSSGRTDFVEPLGYSRKPPKKPPDEFQFVCSRSISIPNQSCSLFDC